MATSVRAAGPLAVLRCDASTSIGGGHLYRCLVLADGLQAAGWQCHFACNNEALEMLPDGSAERHAWHGLDSDAQADPSALRSIAPDGCDLMVVDHYALDAAYERACRTRAALVLVIDDLTDRRHACDILLDQTPDRTPQDYGGLAETGCRFLLGPRYALLRRQFAEARAGRRGSSSANLPPRVLISFGAVDRQSLSVTSLRAALECELRPTIDVVLGSRSAPLSAVQDIAATEPARVRVHVDVDDMASLMAAADLAIGAAGTTSWERCCLGLPSIVVEAVDNQAAIAAALARSGAAEVLGRPDSLSVERLSAAMTDLLSSPDRMHRMATAAAATCDGQGAERTVAAITQAIAA